MKELQAKWTAEGKYVIDIGIGINTGDMVVGNMGAEGKKMDYTVIGDNVNLGARLEGLTRQYNNHIIISEFTYEKVKDIVRVNELGSVTVKGKQKPVVIYDLVGLKSEQAPNNKRRISISFESKAVISVIPNLELIRDLTLRSWNLPTGEVE